VDASSQPSESDINFVVQTQSGEATAAALKFVAGGTVGGNGTMSTTGTSSEIQVHVSATNGLVDRVWTFRNDGAIVAGDGTNSRFRITQTGFANLASNIEIAQTYGLVYNHPTIGGSFIPGTTSNGTLVEAKGYQYYQIDSDNSTTGTARYSWRADGSTPTAGVELMSLNEDRTLTVTGTIEHRNSTTSQKYNIYNTYTDASNYERAALKWDSNNFTFSTEALGTGTVRNFNFAGGNVGINTPGTVSYPLQITGRTTDGITARILNQSPTGGYGLWVESNDQNSGIFQVAFNSIGGPSANLLTNLGSNAYFQVYEGTSTKSLQLGQTFSGGVNLSVKSNLQIGIDSDNDGVGAFEIAKANNYNGRLNSDGTSLFRILNNGNVGIGITNPTYKLVIAQDTNTTASLLRLHNTDATYSQTWDFQSDTSKDLVVTGGSGNGGVVFKPGIRGFSLHNGTNAQKLLVYNTYTNDTNYERGSIEWSSNLFLIEAQYSGTGTSRYLRIKTGVNYFELIPSSGQINFSGGTRFRYPSNGTLEVRNSANIPGDLVAGTYSVYTKSGVGSAVATQAGDSTTLTTTTATQIAAFATTHLGAKLVIQAADTVTGERQMSEILLVHDGTTVTLTEYGVIYTNASLATYTAEISGGNVVVKATSASTNSTTYKVMETLI
jgi:hypothetical protein